MAHAPAIQPPPYWSRAGPGRRRGSLWRDGQWATGRPGSAKAGAAGATAQPASPPVADASQPVAGASLTPAPVASTAGVAAAKPQPTATQTISTTEASDLLRQADGDLAADGHAAITMGE